jgi:hypothetical protein
MYIPPQFFLRFILQTYYPNFTFQMSWQTKIKANHNDLNVIVHFGSSNNDEYHFFILICSTFIFIQILYVIVTKINLHQFVGLIFKQLVIWIICKNLDPTVKNILSLLKRVTS